MTLDIKREVELLYSSRHPITWIQTYEETRVLDLISKLSKSIIQGRAADTCMWTTTAGLKENGRPIDNTLSLAGALSHIKTSYNDQTNRLVVLQDVHHDIADPTVMRHLRDLHLSLGLTTTSIFMVSPPARVPKDIQKIVALLELPLPDRELLSTILSAEYEVLSARSKKDTKWQRHMNIITPLYEQHKGDIVTAGLGLTIDEFTSSVRKTLVRKDFHPRYILDEKKQAIRKTGVLEWLDTDVVDSQVGGLGAFKEWMMYAKKSMLPAARDYGIKPLRGVLLVGPPGTGKTLLAKMTAHMFGIPLLMMDMSSIASQYYGESSSNIKMALDMADAMADDVLLLDEIEKMFATGGAGEGHEETMRVLSVLLTHMEESTAPVFRVATCNNPLNLKPEIIQRFPKIFFIDLPNEQERSEILRIHLRLAKQDPNAFDIAALAHASNHFVGREIRNVIQDTMIKTFYADRALTTDDLINSMNMMTPLASQDKIKDEIDRVRDWAKVNAIAANVPDNHASV